MESIAEDVKALTPTGDRPAIKWPVIISAGVIIIAIATWAMVAPEHAATVLGEAVGWTSEWLGWFYILLATAVLVFVIYLGLRYAHVRLGADTDRPEFRTFTWACMLFAAGIGTDIMFFAVAEPVAQYLAPPQRDAESLDAAREATVWTLFHYGITGWGMYALMGLALGYCAHRIGLPLAVRSALYPLFGRRISGGLGHAVDIATTVGTIFGVATSLGIGVVQLNVGLNIMFGTEQGLPAQAGLIVLAVITATVSATTGVDRGIRVLSLLNVLLALFLAGWLLVTGNTAFLLRALTMNVGDFVALFPGMTLDTMAFDYPAEWMTSWTLFFWAWWIAWASFVGMFLARISKGRTIGQFVLGTLLIPFSYVLMWVSIFGNSALDVIRSGNTEFGQTTLEQPELGFYTLLQQYPGALFIVGLATFVGLLFYVTSADSGALVMANLSSTLPSADVDAAPLTRIFWGVTTGVLTLAVLIVGGIPALQSATVIMALPFAIVMILVMVGLHRVMEWERHRGLAFQQSFTSSLVARPAPGGTQWRTRLARTFGVVSEAQALRSLEDQVLPALADVADALRERGTQAEIEDHPVDAPHVLRSVVLVVHDESLGGFRYPIDMRRVPAPSYGARVLESDDLTTELQVRLPSGERYDLVGYTRDEVCGDVLDHYERHVSYLRLNAETT